MNNKAPDVIVVGELNVDIILNRIEGFPAVGKEIIANTMDVTLGSSSAIFASNLSALGVNVAFIGKIGTDNFANVIIQSLRNRNVDTHHIVESSEKNTGATIVLNYNQDRANVTYPGAMNDFNIKDIDFNFLSGARHMHFSSYFMQPGIKNDIVELFRKAKGLGLTTSLDTQWDPEEKWDIPLKQLLPFVDIFLPNATELQSMTKTSNPIDGIRSIASVAHWIVVKKGSDGATAWDGNKSFEQPAFLNKDVVDCIGAGDSFNAGFIQGYIHHKSIEKCLELGALSGAINTTRAGGTGAFQDRQSVEKIASEIFNYTFEP